MANLDYYVARDGNVLTRWFWRMLSKLWAAARDRFVLYDLHSHDVVILSRVERDLHLKDEAEILTALMLLLEIEQHSKHPIIAARATERLRGVALARLHRCHMDWSNELPRRLVLEDSLTLGDVLARSQAAGSIPDGTGDCGIAEGETAAC